MSSNNSNSTNSQASINSLPPHNQQNNNFADLSQILINCTPKIQIYNSINDVLSTKNKFQVNDGVLFWHFNRWQPMYGCCKILSIRSVSNSNATKLFTIGTKNNIPICEIKENRLCWYPNWTNDNIVLLQNVHIDASQKLNVENKKWDGHSLCLSHSRCYIPFPNQQYHRGQNSKTKGKRLCSNRNVLYSINGNPFLSSQTLTNLENQSVNFDWNYPPKYVKWMCEKIGRDFEIDYPKKFEFLRATEKAFDYRPQLSTNIEDIENISENDENKNENDTETEINNEEESKNQDENEVDIDVDEIDTSVSDSMFVSNDSNDSNDELSK